MWTTISEFGANYGSGFPVSEPTHDPATVRNQLNYLHSAYPNQFFVVDTCGTDKSKVVVSWIPDWLNTTWVNYLFSQALYTSASPSWPAWPNG